MYLLGTTGPPGRGLASPTWFLPWLEALQEGGGYGIDSDQKPHTMEGGMRWCKLYRKDLPTEPKTSLAALAGS